MKQIDVERLYVELDRRRRHEGTTWSAIAKKCGSSPAAMSRMGRGTVPTADVFVRLLLWLGTTDFGGFLKDS